MGIPPQDLARRGWERPRIPTAPVEVAIGIPAEPPCGDALTSGGAGASRPPRMGRGILAWRKPISIRPFPSSAPSAIPAEALPELFRSTAFQGSIGPSFRWKILNYGRILNNVRLQKAKFQELVTGYEQSVLNANQEAENGLVTFYAPSRACAAGRERRRGPKSRRPGTRAIQGGHRRLHPHHPARAEPGAAAEHPRRGPRRNRSGVDPGLSRLGRRLGDPQHGARTGRCGAPKNSPAPVPPPPAPPVVSSFKP